MKTHLFATAMLAAFLGWGGSATAMPTTVTWDGEADGDNLAITFAGFTANTLTSITGSAFYHNHGDTSVVTQVQLIVDGSPITIFMDTNYDDSSHLLASIPEPITFAAGVVTGINLLDAPVVGFGFHGFYDTDPGTQFTFDSVAVPEPVSLALLGVGLVGVGAARRKRA